MGLSYDCILTLLSSQFLWAFDVYLKIIHDIEQCICKALEHNTKDWQLLNLDFDWLVFIDGNNSLKAKCPLTIFDHLLSIYGANGCCAYDIKCAFSKTVKNSVLGLKAHTLKLHFMVGAFHSHAHNWKCQIDWHLMYIKGVKW
ncbi:hypothetical protein PAXRUDRAFT_36077 [Paxillus rubicundulus Ve08.2h10]|uniref:Unplaced genomic scaffold scaffold_1104, whole genome shotgun sequence n=1 Tax=Paxillus rubicundulus Ve08.2h10 TaxID=930991 RepID=A0A0D0CYV0_9AGAM|nr:hypothetical protein PAXRUDRAFT_36077 [Paxillus rubicundulus Ve08.2h10]